MNLLLLTHDETDVAAARATVTGTRARHAREVLRAAPGERLIVGLLGGRAGSARVVASDGDRLELDDLRLDQDPPAKLPFTLLLALPRPKVLARTVAAATSLGVARIVLLNAWRVEKSYWSDRRLAPPALEQAMRAGLEQARDTVLPELRLARLFRPFLEQELPALSAGSTALVAHPQAGQPATRALAGAVTLAVGPEGGFIPAEIESLERAGFAPVSLGPRALRVETAVAALIGRLA